jgi:hypothetical protein
VTVTGLAAGSEVGWTDAMIGDGNTAKYTAVPVTPEAVTVTFPLFAPVGTVTTI